MLRSTSKPLLRTQSDERLVELARQGHERAFEAIVERYRRPLYRECRRILPAARAEDAVQHALLAAWRALGRGDDVRDLRHWLHRIARNTALNAARAPGFEWDELRETLTVADAPEDELERRSSVEAMLAGIAALPDRQREALVRTAVEGERQDAVARDLGLSSGAVRQLVHRARAALRAAATAITPLPLVAWIAAASPRAEPIAQRISELAAAGAGAGAAATAAKVGAVAVVAGGALGGQAMLDDRDRRPQPGRSVEIRREAPPRHADRPPVRVAVRTPEGPAADGLSTRRPQPAVAPPAAPEPVRPAASGDDAGEDRRTRVERDDPSRREREREREHEDGELEREEERDDGAEHEPEAREPESALRTRHRDEGEETEDGEPESEDPGETESDEFP